MRQSCRDNNERVSAACANTTPKPAPHPLPQAAAVGVGGEGVQAEAEHEEGEHDIGPQPAAVAPYVGQSGKALLE